jgi:hypothetical protein
VDVILNVILFVPPGVGLRLAGMSWRRAVMLAGLLSFTVEALQLVAVSGRDASLSDLVSNTAGGALGVWLAPRLHAAALPAPALARRLLVGGAAVWVVLLALSAWLQAPGTSDGTLNSNWAHHVPKPYPFNGQVLSAALHGAAMPPHGPPSDSAAVRDRLGRGEAELALRAVTGQPTNFGGWIYMMAAGDRPQLVVTQKATRATIAVPARALRFKLRSPSLSLSDGLPRVAGTPFALEGGRHGHRVWLETSYAGRRRAAELLLSPAHGWALVAPFGFSLGPLVRLVTAACIAAVIVPLGYWGAAAGRPAWGLTVLGLAIAAGLGAVPALGGYAPVHWSEWLAAVLAAAGGWALGRPAAYLEPRCGPPSTSVSSSS